MGRMLHLCTAEQGKIEKNRADRNRRDIGCRGDNLFDRIGWLARCGLDPHRLHLEITESVLMDDVERAGERLHQLHDLGVCLIVDDFGTGYSSLSYLSRFPVDTLKVDRSFVRGLGLDPTDTAIVRAVITLAHNLGLRAVGEGVERGEHLEALRTLDCDLAQGFLLARPQPAHGIGRLLEATLTPVGAPTR